MLTKEEKQLVERLSKGTATVEDYKQVREPCPLQNEIKTLIIPDGVIEVGNWGGVKNLERVTIPRTVRKIDGFKGCTNLKEVKISEGPVSIADEAFYRCKRLEKIELPRTVSVIGQSAFELCKGLKEVVIRGTPRIFSFAFRFCDNLTKAIVPSGCKLEDESIFNGCPKMK